jgi:hypothetical protein
MKNKITFLVVMVLLVTPTIVAAQSVFASIVRLTIKDNNGLPINLQCGLRPDATDGLDANINEEIIPNFHPPCINNFHAAFREPDGNSISWGSFWTYTDFRSLSYNPPRENYFAITLCAGDRPYVDFSWEIDGKDGLETAQLTDRFGNVVVANLLETSSVRSTLFTENYRIVLKNKPTVSVNEENLVESTTLYPNPASNSLLIRHGNDVSSIDVTTMLGSNVVSFSPKNNETNSTLNVSNLSSGTYIVRILSFNNSIETKIFVKQ